MKMKNGQNIYKYRTLTYNLQQPAQEAKLQPLRQSTKNGQNLVDNHQLP